MKRLLLPFLLLCTTGCAKTNAGIKRPNSINEGLDEILYLNSFSYYCKNYDSYSITLKNDFSATISYKITGEEYKTYETKYSYNTAYFYEEDNLLIEFENYLPEPNDVSEIDFSTNKEIVLSAGYCLIDYGENVLKYSRLLAYGNNSSIPLHAYFSKEKSNYKDYYSFNEKYQLKEQKLSNPESSFEYLNLAFCEKQRLEIEYKIQGSESKTENIQYEYLDCVVSQTTSGINLLGNIETDILTISGSLSFVNDNSLLYMESNSSFQNKLIFERIY